MYVSIYIYHYIPLHPTTSHYIPLYIHVKSYINITYPPSDWFRRVPPFFRDSGLKVWFGKVARRPVTLATPGPEMLRTIIFYGKVHLRSLKYSIETCVSIETGVFQIFINIHIISHRNLGNIDEAKPLN